MKRLVLMLAFVLMLCAFPGSLANAASGEDDWWDWPPLEETFAVSGTVWHDLNQNGYMDEGEPTVSGIKVEIQPMEEELGFGSGVSDSRGFYKTKDDFYAGEYVVSFIDPDKNYTKTKTILNDKGVPIGSGIGAEISLDAENCTVNIGLIRLISLSGEVYEDINENGQRDKGEPPLEAEVELYWGANTSISDNTEYNKSDFLFKVDVTEAVLSIVPSDASYLTLEGKASYEEKIDFTNGDITGKSYGFSKKKPEPTEPPVPEETLEPTETPEPVETLEPVEAPAETNRPAESLNAYVPTAVNTLPAYAAAPEKNREESNAKYHAFMARTAVIGSKVYHSNEGMEYSPFSSETAKKARMSDAEDRAVLNYLLQNIEDDFSGWIFINGVQYYCSGNGALLRGGFELVDGEYYYFTPLGEALFKLA